MEDASPGPMPRKWKCVWGWCEVDTSQRATESSPRCLSVPAVAAESRPSRFAVAARALTRRPRPGDGSYRGDGGGPGDAGSAQVGVMIAGPLAGH